MRRPRALRAADRGTVPVEWVAAVGLLLLPTVLLVGLLPGWAARQSAAAAAAREAVRVAMGHDDVAAARVAGEQAALAVLAGRGHLADARLIQVAVPDVDADGIVDREGRVAARVVVAVPAVPVPGMGAVGGFDLSGGHARVLDPLRSRR